MFPFVYLCFPVTNERMEKNDVLKPHEVVSFSMAETSWFFFSCATGEKRNANVFFLFSSVAFCDRLIPAASLFTLSASAWMRKTNTIYCRRITVVCNEY